MHSNVHLPPTTTRRLEVYARIVRSITKRPPILLGAHCRVTALRWILIDDRQISILYYFLLYEITRTNINLIVGVLGYKLRSPEYYTRGLDDDKIIFFFIIYYFTIILINKLSIIIIY